MKRCWKLVLVAALAVCACATAAGADVIVRVSAPDAGISVGAPFEVAIVASLSDPVLAWGLDLSFDSGLLELQGTAEIGSDWGVPVATVDGDGLAGAAFPSGVTGAEVLLATLSFLPLTQGTAELLLSSSAADLTEGFALDPFGFDARVTYLGDSIEIVPEPSTGICLGMGLLTLGWRRRRRPQC